MTSPTLSQSFAGIAAVLRDIAENPEETSGEPLARLVSHLRPTRRSDIPRAIARLQAFVEYLGSEPELAEGLGAHVEALLKRRMHRTLFAESGILSSVGFFSGLWQRLLGELLPPAVDNDFLRDLVKEVFDERHDGEWVAAVPRTTWVALLERLGCFGERFAAERAHIRQELLEAMRMSSHLLAALGLESSLVRYLPALANRESPLLAQTESVRAVLLAQEADRASAAKLDEDLNSCSAFVARVREQAHETGVDVSLVFVIARAEQLVDRLRVLRRLVVPAASESPEAQRARAVEFLVTLIRAENRRNRLSDVFEGTTQLLARRVTEHASRSGEHYVTESREEYREMFRAAAGAGLIVGVMALAKILAAGMGLPGFWQAVAFSLVYGLGFVVIHVLHLTIATKQPAMTAATLAAAIDGMTDRDARLDRLSALAAQVSRTQWVSIAGNVSIGFLTALAIGLVAKAFLGWEPVAAEKAGALLHDLHPWKSLALVHAGIAGVYLFLSGLISGYYDNQAIYHRIPERLRRVKWLRRLLGQPRLDRVALYVENNFGALVGNFLFGCMLGATGTVGAFFGLPVDIRHVSFASANLAFALQALDFEVAWSAVAIGVAGVLLIGAVNLIVSFRLALKVALRSRGIGPDETDGLTRRVLARLRTSPREFFLPPR